MFFCFEIPRWDWFMSQPKICVEKVIDCIGILNFLDYRKILGEPFETLWVLRLQQVVCLAFFRNKTLQVYQKLEFSKNQPTVVNPHKNPVFSIFFWNPTPEQQIREWPKKNITWIFLPTILSDQVTCALLLHLQWLHLPWTHQVSYLQKEVGLGSGEGNFSTHLVIYLTWGSFWFSYPPGGFSNLVKVDFVFFFCIFFSPWT